MDEKLRFDQVFCAALTGLLSRSIDHGYAVNEAYRVATMAVARVNENKIALTQAEEEAELKRLSEEGNGKNPSQANKGHFQRPAGA